MGRTIIVDPQKLEDAAKRIDELEAQYKKQYELLFSEVAGMKKAWTGKDNQAFADQIEGFRQDFEQMQKTMHDYSDFLKHSATEYRKAQDEIYEGAKKLTN